MGKVKAINLIVLTVLIVNTTGCVIGSQKKAIRREKLKGWEQIRIEKQVPSKNCVYKIQDYCYGVGAKCYKQFKRNAAINDANTVVITDVARSQKKSGSIGISGYGGMGEFESVETMTALADYYYCPKDKEPSCAR